MDSVETSGRRYNPHSNRGRRKQIGDSSSGRNLQMRDAQRALRARKQEYLLSLEKKVSDVTRENVLLKQQLQILSLVNPQMSQVAVPCINQNCAAQIQALQLRVLELQAALMIKSDNVTSMPANSSDLMVGSEQSSPTTTMCRQQSLETVNSNNYIFVQDFNRAMVDSPSAWIQEIGTNKPATKYKIWQSAEELYGPVDAEPFIARAKLIKSVEDTKFVERIFNLLTKVSKATDTKTAQILHLKIIREQLRINRKFTIVDFVAFVEIMSEYHMKYKLHNIHWREMCAFEGPKPKIIKAKSELPRVTNFRNTLKEIPSFSNYHHVIEDMCDLWNSDNKYGPEELNYMKYLVHSLMIACETAEDHVKFKLAFFLVRQNKCLEMDEVISDLEAISLK
ncbi:hypothetical protein HK100_009224 [Physocladia obscura]|uniref:BZIP domain-containing protein n=1 Tax=Physocladia obscura TaxID=109957 RepID=A0AAD5XHR1_9FUNG|nr:hypothetical protein HK100_009224 [Physocladia obscura]